MLTGPAPTSWVASTTIFAPTSWARLATALTSMAVPVAYCTALMHTTDVEPLMASINAVLRSVCGSFLTQRLVVASPGLVPTRWEVKLRESAGYRGTLAEADVRSASRLVSSYHGRSAS